MSETGREGLSIFLAPRAAELQGVWVLVNEELGVLPGHGGADLSLPDGWHEAPPAVQFSGVSGQVMTLAVR